MQLAVPAHESVIWLVLLSFGAWRITAMFCYEAGPFSSFTKLRSCLVHVGLGRVALCFHCSATWISAALVLLTFEATWRTPILVLGVAGAVSIVERWLRGNYSED